MTSEGTAGEAPDAPPENPHFRSVPTWEAAARELAFEPARPGETGGRALMSLAIFVKDHRMRDLPLGERNLEAYFDGFVFSQARQGVVRAREAALSTPYGASPRPLEVGSHEGRGYERGPAPAPGDLDAPLPAVVVWHAGEMFYLLASEELAVDELLAIARSVG